MVKYSPYNKITEATFLGGGKTSSATVYDLTLKGCRRLRELEEKNKRAKNPKTLGQIVNQLFLEKGSLFVKEEISVGISQEEIAEIRKGILRTLNLQKDAEYYEEKSEYQRKQDETFWREHSAWVSNTLEKYGVKPKKS